MISVTISLDAWDFILPDVLILLLLALSLPIYAYAIPRWLCNRIHKRRAVPSSRRDLSKEIGAAAALTCFVISLFCTLYVTILATPIAIDVAIGGQPQRDDFEGSRAMIVVAPVVLASGLAALGFSYCMELLGSSRFRQEQR